MSTATDVRPGVGAIRSFFHKVQTVETVDDIPDLVGQLEKIYNAWADEYENDFNAVGWRAPYFAGVIVNELFPDNKEAMIIECGAGTGLSGQQMFDHGFTNITGVDLSDKCLEIAMSKGVYKAVAKCAVGAEKLPFEDQVADMLVTTGSMSPTHIPPESLPDQVRVVKKGGYLVIITRKLQVGGSPSMCQEYHDNFDNEMERLISTGQISLINERTIPGYVDGKDGLVYICKVL